MMKFNARELGRTATVPVAQKLKTRTCEVTSFYRLNGKSPRRRVAFSRQEQQSVERTARSIPRASDECDFLREENHSLRQKLYAMMVENPDLAVRLAGLLEQHQSLVDVGQDIGECIPSLSAGLETSDCLDTMDRSFDISARQDLDEQQAEEVVVEIEGDDTLVFRFQGLTAVSNNLVSSSMSSSSSGNWSPSAQKIGSSSAPANLEASRTSVTRGPVKSKQDIAIESANKEVESHDSSSVINGKDNWLFLTVPSELVAGAKAVMYFNKAQSEVLQHRPNVQLHAKFNHWELDMGISDRVDMQASGVRKEGADFVKAEFVVPKEAFEINFIFSDQGEVYDNNDMNNYCLPVTGEMTQEKWIDSAPERAEAEFLKRQEEERIMAEKAEKERERLALEEDARKSQDIINNIKSQYSFMTENAVTSLVRDSGEKVITSEQKTVRGSTQIRILYNRKATNLSGLQIDDQDAPIMLKLGHNGWQNVIDVPMKRVKSSSKQTIAQEEWWEVSIKVPLDAVCLNMVTYWNESFDNNNEHDYCISVDRGDDIALWADSIQKPLEKAVTAARREEEKRAKELVAQKVRERQAIREKTEQVRRLQMRHVLYTKPEVPEAGGEVTICYNPNNTNLNGSSEVSLTLGFNRWRHPKSTGPIVMKPSQGEHYEATVSVPKDAYALDFVFSNESQQYDNRGGLDYNIPVLGSVVQEPPLYAVHIAVEMAPIAKVGGMGDVVTALGRAVEDLGHHVEVILPKYDFFSQSPLLGAMQYETEFEWGGTRIFVSTCIVEGIRVWFVEPANGMFSGGSVYQGSSDAGRFDFFSHAALEFLLRTQRQPDIIHCHDWSTATVARAYWTQYHERGLWKPNVVFTIHNLNYGADLIGEASYYSQRFTTVSPSYAWEIGSNPAIAANNAKLIGVRNGIDVDIWNPETDQFLPLSYSAASCESGKAAAREALRSRLGLTGWGDKPLVGVVTRLTKQKGTHLIAHSCWKTLERGGQFVLLGSAPDPKVQAEFDGLAQMHGGENAAFYFAFDEPLSHLIYAACDLILVPSMFEPCGLTQMIAMRYGAVPVVRSTGGLKDTVFDVDTDKARAAWELEGSTDWEADDLDVTNGFSFEGTDEGALDYALNRALDAYYNDRSWFRSLQERVMKQDWSWNKPAIDYIQLYYAAMKK